ncbi:hypothetical protein [Pedobacter nototheniae]|uniref:hypothetical protein n=1 Tax=Pedobacter nototheniae TaxID=2488994 RepID=UPI00103EB071|nr:hypothetical protein [Pedobacter nototheniae]
MTTNNPTSSKSHFLNLFFLSWLAINVIQSILTGVHPDEAYYLMYAKYLDWGYFDHPSIVVIRIKSFSWIYTNTITQHFICLFEWDVA